MDVLITAPARRDIEALAAFRPKPGAWGALVGHRRGPRIVVERAVLGGAPGTRPDETTPAVLDRIFPGRLVGLAVVRPGPAFRRAVLGPAWYGRVVLSVTGPAAGAILRPALVEYERRFFLAPVRLAPPGKERSHE